MGVLPEKLLLLSSFLSSCVLLRFLPFQCLVCSMLLNTAGSRLRGLCCMAVDLWKRLSRDNCSNIIISFLLRCVITTLFHMWGGREETYRHLRTFFFLLEVETCSSEPRSPSLASRSYSSSKQKQLPFDHI